MLVPRQVLEEVGVFDPELFFYSEDTDWSLRAREAGYRHYVVPASKLWHKVSVTSGGENSPTTLYYGIRNTIAVCERHAPLGAVRHLAPPPRSCSPPTSSRPGSRAASARASPQSPRAGGTSAPAGSGNDASE